MSSTTFIDGQTVIKAAWLNDVNTEVYTNTHVNSITAGTDITVTSNTGNPVIALATTIHSNTTGNAATATTANSANTATTAGTCGELLTANFSIQQVSGKLYFYYGSTQIASLDSSGNFTALANVSGAGTP